MCVYVGDLDALVRAAGSSVAHWTHALTMLSRESPEYWGALTVGAVATKMAIAVGTTATLDCVASLGLDAAMGPEAAVRLLKARALEKEQSTLAREVLESLDSFLWSKRSDDVPLPLQLMMDAELASNGGPLEAAVPNDLESSAFLLTAPMQHWGCQAKVATEDFCPLCRQPLVAMVEQLQVYPCGKVYCNTCRPAADACACSRCLKSERLTSARVFTA